MIFEHMLNLNICTTNKKNGMINMYIKINIKFKLKRAKYKTLPVMQDIFDELSGLFYFSASNTAAAMVQ